MRSVLGVEENARDQKTGEDEEDIDADPAPVGFGVGGGKVMLKEDHEHGNASQSIERGVKAPILRRRHAGDGDDVRVSNGCSGSHGQGWCNLLYCLAQRRDPLRRSIATGLEQHGRTSVTEGEEGGWLRRRLEQVSAARDRSGGAPQLSSIAMAATCGGVRATQERDFAPAINVARMELTGERRVGGESCDSGCGGRI